MAVQERYSPSGMAERWSNGTQGSDPAAGYYAGSPLALQRPLTVAEQAALAAIDAGFAQMANGDSLRTQAAAALASNRAFVSQAKPGTAAAQASQAYDQAVKLSRQNNGLIRLLLGLLDGTD